mgnify:CR=1 FL=1
MGENLSLPSLQPMPAKSVPDGPVCPHPKSVVEAWLKHPVLAERCRNVERLVQSEDCKELKDKNGTFMKKPIVPSRKNMINNSIVLEVLAKDMSARMRVGADPIDVLCVMTLGYYASNKYFDKVANSLNLKAVAYSDAWTIHKMVSQFRSPVSRYSSTRDICLELLHLKWFALPFFGVMLDETATNSCSLQ